MMDKDFLITFLLKSVTDENHDPREFKFYLFGSQVSSGSDSDVDILIVYDSDRIGIPAVLSLRRKIQSQFVETFGLDSDICLLSAKETIANCFIEDEKAALLNV